MGPRSRERGEVLSRHLKVSERLSFNGAALAGARRGADVRLGGSNPSASMGPRSRERGEVAHLMGVYFGDSFNGAALAGARRGDEPRCIYIAGSASMGPRSRERGELTLELQRRGAWLQWGRARGSAERSVDRAGRVVHVSFNGAALAGARRAAVQEAPPQPMLQWGRARGSAESPENYHLNGVNPPLHAWS